MGIYKRHTLAHHQFFTDHEPTIDNTRDFRITFFPPYALSAFICMSAAAGLVLGLVWSANAGVAAGLHDDWRCTSITSSSTGAAMSRTTASSATSRFMNTIRRHHIAHHNQSIMMGTNMNLTYPIADWLFGTTDLDRGLLGHIFNGYDTRYPKRDLKKARTTAANSRLARRPERDGRRTSSASMPSLIGGIFTAIVVFVLWLLLFGAVQRSDDRPGRRAVRSARHLDPARRPLIPTSRCFDEGNRHSLWHRQSARRRAARRRGGEPQRQAPDRLGPRRHRCGAEGIGVAYFGGALTGTLRHAIDELGALAVGEDPHRVEAIHRQVQERGGRLGRAGRHLQPGVLGARHGAVGHPRQGAEPAAVEAAGRRRATGADLCQRRADARACRSTGSSRPPRRSRTRAGAR